MSNKVMTRAVVGCAFGFGFGLIVILLFPLAAYLPSFYMAIYAPINTPINWIISILRDYDLMPHGDNGFFAMFMVSSMMMLVQCSLVGFLVGLCSGKLARGQVSTKNK